ncbi:MAG: sigma-70 family RNA polymerase sigma factor [Planctomycetota bacterium]|nr:MAG: sigma-70 family RNA polymerase sigma factor [Planctomycetota bacterium]
MVPVPAGEPWDRLAADLASHAGALRRMASELCGPGDSEDAVQGAAVLALEGRAAPSGARPVDWLAGLVRNVARNARRGASRRRARELASAAREAVASAAARAERFEVEARLANFVRELPAAQCEVLYLRFWEDLPPRAIAARLGLDVEAVKSRQKRALAALRERLDRESGGGREAWLSALGAIAPGETGVAGASGTAVSAATTAATTAAGAAAPLALGAFLLGAKHVVGAALVVALGFGAWWMRSVPEAPTPPPPPPTALSTPLALAPAGADASAPNQAPASARAAAPQERVLPPGTFLIRGRVLDLPADAPIEQGVPAVGVAVTLQPSVESFGGGSAADPTTRTDAEGRFEFECTPPADQPFTRSVSAAGDEHHFAAAAHVQINSTSPQVLDVLLERFGRGALVGEVVDLRGEPVAGATIESGAYDHWTACGTSDAQGRFTVECPEPGGALRARRAGYAPVGCARPARGERGGWIPVRITLARSATLLVAFEDALGRPVAGASVSPSISPAEIYGTEGAALGDELPIQRAISDAEGIARLDDVWAELRLRLQVAPGASHWRVERSLDGVALVDRGARAPEGRPIVLVPDSVEHLSVRVGKPCVVAGLVLGPDRQPCAGAQVRVNALGGAASDPAWPERAVDRSVQTDEAGRFRCEVHVPDGIGALRVVAHNESFFGFGSVDWSKVRAAYAVVDPSQPPRELELVLGALHSISGRVVDEAGAPVRTLVRAEPLDEARTDGELVTGFRGTAMSDASGAFEIRGLPPGRFQVFGPASGADAPRSDVVEAGATGVLLRMRAAKSARIAVEVVPPPGVEMQAIVVMNGGLAAAADAAIDAAPLAAESTWREPRGWPEHALGLWYGSQHQRIALGDATFNSWPIQGRSASFDVEQGWHWFGAKGLSASGVLCFPMGTGLVHVGEGEHRVVLQLVLATSVAGRVDGFGAASELCVALFPPSGGSPIPLPGRRDAMESFVELGADGSFRLELVPAGAYELRVGTRAELESGRYRAKRELELSAGERHDVVFAR